MEKGDEMKCDQCKKFVFNTKVCYYRDNRGVEHQKELCKNCYYEWENNENKREKFMDSRKNRR